MTIELNDTVRTLLDSPHPGVLATINPDGSPQSSVVWVTRDGGDVLISTEQGRRKERNISRDGRVGLTVFDLANPFLYVEIRGTATVTEDAGRAVAVRIAEKYAGPGAGKDYADAPPENVRVVVRITPDKVLGNAAR
ncbi:MULTISPECIES: PPOX class F420-dependent oxidoreductase [unclassified Streptomyces]|uniref:PPOX class F420-dependent oxidoreductase n=1 Tax=unclassified Streptomyces TaxID=2593676 RepID=UPI001BE856C9|nr:MULTISPECIES: PPOX class F420-dependent oxidoreductase [unclassified Streptomyces]MBT2404050.1 PPOX class F420-dependent oxidoreductase [Streptomyces sp. ISL-21]MBT2455763.1 PPOX class F420-dependent oxidoreductase [Streptomyces sp. ISL-86]MBT2607905.1 PPOX class F420-dependent oxidoreductase [Streptomyces sp. ISL-87]